MATKIELVVTALQERIGQMAANYETQVAVLRAEITQLSDELKKYTDVQEENSDQNSN